MNILLFLRLFPIFRLNYYNYKSCIDDEETCSIELDKLFDKLEKSKNVSIYSDISNYQDCIECGNQGCEGYLYMEE